jgi:hypothetical protein
VQMVSTHNLAMTFLASAAKHDQTAEGVELFTNSANRLLQTFTAQVEVLKTCRSKGPSSRSPNGRSTSEGHPPRSLNSEKRQMARV